MKINTCQFVDASDLFNGLSELWSELVESEPDFTWGNNNRSLVVADDILNHFDNSVIENEGQLETLRKRVQKLPEGGQIYVDLEN